MTGVESSACFAALQSYAGRLEECDLATFLADNARAQELIKKGETATQSDFEELMGLAQTNVPGACKSALACFGSSLVGAKEIILVVTLPYATKEAFTSDLQLEFREALARVAGVPVAQVIIIGILLARRSGMSEDPGGMRHLLQGAGSISVQTQVTTPSDPVGREMERKSVCKCLYAVRPGGDLVISGSCCFSTGLCYFICGHRV